MTDLPPFTQLMLYGLGLLLLGVGVTGLVKAFWLFVTLLKAPNEERLKYFSRSWKERIGK